MSNNIERLERIEKYVSGEMTAKELSDFELQLQKDSELRAEVEIFRDVMLGAALFGGEELAEEIKSTHQFLKEEGFFKNVSVSEAKQIKMENNNQSNVRKIGLGKWWALAAGITLIITAGYFVFNNGGHPNPEEVFAQIYKPESTIINIILDDLSSPGFAAADDPHTDSLEAALKFYKMDDFDKAQNYLADLVQKKPEDHTARLYLGLSLLQKAEYANASRHLQVISQQKDFRHKDVADWYLALSYLGYNSTEGLTLAKERLKIIANNPNSSYHEDAEDALMML